MPIKRKLSVVLSPAGNETAVQLSVKRSRNLTSPKKSVIIDPDGDLTLCLQRQQPKLKYGLREGLRGSSANRNDAEGDGVAEGNGCADKQSCDLHILVSAKHMMLASPVFKAMLKHSRFIEGATLHAEGAVEVPLPDDDPAALAILIDITHCRSGRVPTKVDLKLLTHLAMLVDKYQLHQAIEGFCVGWIEALKGGAGIPRAFSGDLLPWLCISWVFAMETEFKQFTRILQHECTKSLAEPELNSEWNLPVSKAVFVAIEDARQAAISSSLSALDAIIEKYKGTAIICKATESAPTRFGGLSMHGRDCDAMVFGTTIKGAIFNSLYPLPQKPYPGLSYQEVQEKLSKLEIQTACGKVAQAQVLHKHQAHVSLGNTNCNSVKTTVAAAACEAGRALAGLDLKYFKKLGNGST